MLKFLRHLFNRSAGLPLVPPLPKRSRLAAITSDERLALEKWAHDPVTRLALSLVDSRRPTMFLSRSGVNVVNEMDERASTNRFHQLQGWELFLNAITVIHVPEKQIQQVRETYQSENA